MNSLLCSSLIAVSFAALKPTKCPHNSEFGLTGEFNCDLEIKNSTTATPQCWCQKRGGFARKTNGDCAKWEDCPESQHMCAEFEFYSMMGPIEKTCGNRRDLKVTVSSNPRCQCKTGLVRMLFTGKCVPPRECRPSDRIDQTKKVEKYDTNCSGEKIFYDYGRNTRGFCHKRMVRLRDGECVSKEKCL